jgi:hypothetical protein
LRRSEAKPEGRRLDSPASYRSLDDISLLASSAHHRYFWILSLLYGLMKAHSALNHQITVIRVKHERSHTGRAAESIADASEIAVAYNSFCDGR